MIDWIQWFTRLENSKALALVLFFAVFCGILLYVYSGRERSERLESYKYLPLDDSDDDNETRADRKVN
ncbi:MAG: cbb3-type cytochrome c oxidase subunit 3 [Gammaproteobacteria bacterium]|jgi:cbb3-type cytochrome oxidase subunit 3